jgi:hypothetical protein
VLWKAVLNIVFNKGGKGLRGVKDKNFLGSAYLSLQIQTTFHNQERAYIYTPFHVLSLSELVSLVNSLPCLGVKSYQVQTTKFHNQDGASI